MDGPILIILFLLRSSYTVEQDGNERNAIALPQI